MSSHPALDPHRLARLLDVGRSVLSELDLDVVLDRVLETAADLTGAQYAAIGVLNEERRALSRFLTRGVDEATHRAIGDLPQGRGVLGVLIDHPHPLRLADVGDHPRYYGFPPGHPPMRTFLGVPILVRGQAWGNLYLTEKAGGEGFSESDEDAAVVLSDWAAIASENARLYRSATGRRDELEQAVRGLEATTAIARAVGAETDLDRVLELIVKRGRALIDARSVAILLQEGDDLRVAATAGELERPAETLRVPSEGTVFGDVLRSGEPESLADLSSRVRFGPDELRGSASAALVVPLLFRGRTQGVLMALDSLKDSDLRFDSDAEYLLTSFAAAAANAIATARSVEADRLRHSLEASEQERKRWARELHDETLQELGALKFILTGALRSHDPQRIGGALQQAVEQIGLTIGGLQGLITELRPAAL